MKKLSLAIALLFPLATLASEPGNITGAELTSPNQSTALISESTNRVFIDQIGDNVNINVLQEGSGNTFGSLDRPIYLRGIGQTVTTNQTGIANEIFLEIRNNPTGSVGITVNIEQNGNNNSIDAQCGIGANGAAAATGGSVFAATPLTGCNNANLDWRFLSGSDNNTLTYRGTGNGLTSKITSTGDGNSFEVNMSGNNNTNNLRVAGDNNTFTVNQTGGGAAGNSIVFDLTNTGNVINIAQSGAIDNVINVKSVSNASTFTIIQK